MKRLLTFAAAAIPLMAVLAAFGCGDNRSDTVIQGEATVPVALVDARRGFKSVLRPAGNRKEAVPQPPPNVFTKITYPSPVGPLAGYLSVDPRDGQKHPAIVWITGGDCNSIGDMWSEAPPSNDQTASAFRKAGIITMFPALRGGNDNPGVKEGFLGEVDDVLAAADFLSQQPYVDANRIYLGGHSTGGTLVLLVAESSDRFRAVFSFGPASDVRGYPDEFLPFDTSNPRESELRSPVYWLTSIKSPVFVIEGMGGNHDSLQEMARGSANPQVHFLAVKGANHFDVLAPVCALLAGKILRDVGNAGGIALTEPELNDAFARSR